MFKRATWLIASLCLGLTGLIGCASSGEVQKAASSTKSFTFSGWAGPELRVFSVEPDGLAPDAPVVFVMHGVRRNADEYRDNWIKLAETHGFRVYAPEFTREDYPGAEGYNLGGIAPGQPRVPGAYESLESLFEALRQNRGLTVNKYSVFGHSAGGQFVHRFACFANPPRLNFAIAANAGWYTMPDETIAWPYGLEDVEAAGCNLQDWLEKPLLILLGEEDTNPKGRNLRRTPEALDQGTHRLERGKTFYAAAKARAEAEGWTFNWTLATVPGVDHDNAGMAVGALPFILENAPETGSHTDK
ncbi:MAG: hypothetical protein P8H62_14460 [Henriciella sp.]|nr:hypothetical protein [Henriciella sp.]